MAPLPFPTITLEEHYLPPQTDTSPPPDPMFNDFPPHMIKNLYDVGDARIANMDAGSVTMQVLSHGPAIATPSQCREANDYLARSVAAHPNRLAAFALLPMGEPEAAATELERCVKTLGFRGALIDNHHDGRHYDDSFFWPVFAKAVELDTVLYIHPTYASEEMLPRYMGNYPELTGKILSIAGWGWHVDTGLHILKLFASGLFDKYPTLKIVIGHMGEMLPYQLDRTLKAAGRGMLGKHERGFKQVWDENLWITTSGMFSLNPLRCMLGNTKIERILYSVDYPFSSCADGQAFLEEIRDSGIMKERELEMFAYVNAAKLLGLSVK
ncbi:MAG: hypothetical protein M1828_005012 [Chrysothrix sp. TS-e1954]|nr:MAG: hypothetical protein M1828_005012 [Chrysothrix sp. TS-e1954]